MLGNIIKKLRVTSDTTDGLSSRETSMKTLILKLHESLARLDVMIVIKRDLTKNGFSAKNLLTRKETKEME